mmetsp:Transcript_6819/g.22822  ORF Transcript_6819/g.22822 Transcript_6819/m.22822 type:complete len:345 (+) Transcript_6819:4275-5309(+)
MPNAAVGKPAFGPRRMQPRSKIIPRLTAKHARACCRAAFNTTVSAVVSPRASTMTSASSPASRIPDGCTSKASTHARNACSGSGMLESASCKRRMMRRCFARCDAFLIFTCASLSPLSTCAKTSPVSTPAKDSSQSCAFWLFASISSSRASKAVLLLSHDVSVANPLAIKSIALHADVPSTAFNRENSAVSAATACLPVTLNFNIGESSFVIFARNTASSTSPLTRKALSKPPPRSRSVGASVMNAIGACARRHARAYSGAILHHARTTSDTDASLPPQPQPAAAAAASSVSCAVASAIESSPMDDSSPIVAVVVRATISKTSSDINPRMEISSLNALATDDGV